MKQRLMGDTALSAYNPAAKPREAHQTFRFYQQGVFSSFHLDRNEDLERAYLGTPRAFQLENLPKFVGAGAYVFGEEAWVQCFGYLERIEEQIAVYVRRRATPEWLHLYRRLGVSLSPNLGNKTDAVTTLLVREIAELAMVKYGTDRVSNDLVPSRGLRPRDILGGHYLREAVQRLGSRRAANEEARAVIRSNQLVLVRFDFEDLLDLYRIEGLAYEYWRTGAALRMIGKGASVRRNERTFLDYSLSDELEWLLEHHDETTASSRFSGSLIGSWFPNDSASDHPIQIIAADYNTETTLGNQCDMFRIELEGTAREMVTNFALAPIDLAGFQRASDFIGEAFACKVGFSLLDLSYCLLTLSLLVISPHDAETLARRGLHLSEDEPMLASIVNTCQRGYGAFPGSKISLCDWALSIAGERGVTLEPAKVNACFDYMMLTVEVRAQIGLWSRGRRFPLLPIRGGYLIDLYAIGGLLSTLFVGIRDRTGQRGLAFEAMWQHALAEQGFDLALVGEIEAPDGTKREVDAGVRIGSTLVLMECRAIERPLDYEVGKPNVFAVRQANLLEKLEQVESLRAFLEVHPKGTNYDLGWCRHITHFVVGPFDEFVWSREERFWNDGLKRILSADAMLAWLETMRRDHETTEQIAGEGRIDSGGQVP
jgi:hypothetical protein